MIPHCTSLPALLAAACLLAPLPPAPPASAAHPEPSIVERAWTLDFEYETPEAIAVPSPDGGVDWYWFLPYRIANHTGEDQLFIPEIVIAEDTGQVVQANAGIPTRVFDAIQQRLQNDLLEGPYEVVGRILQGDDHAKESVAIWPNPTRDVDEFRLFISGLSGETQAANNPATGEEILLRRTKMLRYLTPGTDANPARQPIELVEETDVMR